MRKLWLATLPMFLFSPLALGQVSQLPTPTAAQETARTSRSLIFNQTAPGQSTLEVGPRKNTSRGYGDHDRGSYSSDSSSTALKGTYEKGLITGSRTQISLGASLGYEEGTNEFTSSSTFNGVKSTYRSTDNQKGLSDLNLYSKLSNPISKDLALISQLQANLSPGPRRIQEESNFANTQESNALSGGQSLMAILGFEANLSSRVRTGILGTGTLKGERIVWTETKNNNGSTRHHNAMYTGNHEFGGLVFAELNGKSSVLGLAAGASQSGEGRIHSTDDDRSGAYNYDTKPLQMNMVRGYAAFQASPTVSLRPEVTFMEINDPKHFGYDYLQTTSVAMSANIAL